MTTKSDGSTASYYELPSNASELQHLISYKDMNAQIGEIFRACYRYGQVEHSDPLRDAKKIKFYAEAEIARLEQKLQGIANHESGFANSSCEQGRDSLKNELFFICRKFTDIMEEDEFVSLCANIQNVLVKLIKTSPRRKEMFDVFTKYLEVQ